MIAPRMAQGSSQHAIMSGESAAHVLFAPTTLCAMQAMQPSDHIPVPSHAAGSIRYGPCQGHPVLCVTRRTMPNHMRPRGGGVARMQESQSTWVKENLCLLCSVTSHTLPPERAWTPMPGVTG